MSVKPVNFASGFSARISGLTNALITRIAAAAVGSPSSAVVSFLKESAMARVQASVAALAAA